MIPNIPWTLCVWNLPKLFAQYKKVKQGRIVDLEDYSRRDKMVSCVLQGIPFRLRNNFDYTDCEMETVLVGIYPARVFNDHISDMMNVIQKKLKLYYMSVDLKIDFLKAEDHKATGIIFLHCIIFDQETYEGNRYYSYFYRPYTDKRPQWLHYVYLSYTMHVNFKSLCFFRHSILI